MKLQYKFILIIGTVLPVRNWIQYIFMKMRGELNYFFRVAGGTEPSATATAGQEIFVMTIGTTDSCEPLM